MHYWLLFIFLAEQIGTFARAWVYQTKQHTGNL